jgi:hypothetical protein
MKKAIATLVATISLAAPSLAQASVPTTLYDSTPVAGTVSVPSLGPEAYSFNHIGNEVLLHAHNTNVRHVRVTMVSWACQTGSWTDGSCTTTPGTRFPASITLHLYRYSRPDASGAFRPGRQITSVTKTFSIKFRPTSDPTDAQHRYMGSDGQFHNGIAQTISFPLNVRLGNDVVWTVSYNTDHSGINPIGGNNSPLDSLNVGLSPTVQYGHDRFPGSLFWDTRDANQAHGSPFIPGKLNLDRGWTGYVPAASFSTR